MQCQGPAVHSPGASGGGIRIVDAKKHLSMSDGCISQDFNCRVALLAVLLQPKYITWPNAEEHQSMTDTVTHNTRYEGLQAILDGTDYRIQRPDNRVQRQYYSGKKKQHCTTVQFTVDPLGRVIHITRALPGSMHDKKIFDQYV